MRNVMIGLCLGSVVGLGMIGWSGDARAASSTASLNVQGILRDGNGALQTMATSLDVSFYDTATSTTPFYTQHVATVAVDNGFFAVELSGTGLTFAGHPDTFIGILVAGDTVELPRQHLDATPYAFSAASADSLSAACTGCVTNAMLAGNVDGSKVGKVAQCAAADTATTATSATTATNATNAVNATNATTATNATQLGGVAASGWQRVLSTTACPAGQHYSSIGADGTASCTAPSFTTSGGTNGVATTVARGDHTHAGLGTGWVKIFDQVYNGNGVVTIPVTASGGFSVRVLFTGTITPFSGPSELYFRTSGGGATGYSSLLVGEGAATQNTGPVQPGLIAGRCISTSNCSLYFDYTLTELPSGGGVIGSGTGGTHNAGSGNATMLFRAGGNAEYASASTSISFQFWNTSNVTGHLVALQLQ